MNFRMAQRILGLMLMIFSLTMLPPIAVSFIYADGHWEPFLVSAAMIASAGLLLWMPARNTRRDLRVRDGFLIVSVFWVFLGLAGATPLFLSDVPDLSFTDSVFEAVSGFTTTGTTVIVGLDELPKSILYYRQQIQWFGGMGIIVLAVAILPILGIGGMSLYKAETPGPMKDHKLTPRITQTAKALWTIYLSLTVACVAAYWLVGMSLFDAVAHAFSTVSTAGFSPYDASLKHFDSIGVDAVATVFMFLSGASFALHFTVLKRRELGAYWRDTEFKAYFLLTAGVTVFVGVYLRAMSEFPTFAESFRHAAFQVVSMQTTTGLVTSGIAQWPGALPVLLVLLSFVGGCAGSTTGGMKVIRWLVVFRQGVAELKQLVHPSAEVPVKLAGRPVPQRIILGVGGFFAMYLIVFAVLMLLLMMFDFDQVTAWSTVAASLNNVGPGLADLTMTFRDVSDSAKWVCALAMLIGRLEIFALLLLLTPAFWER